MPRKYADWNEYLAAGRDKDSRPIDRSRTKRVLRGADGNIRLRLHDTDVVTLCPDGTEIIDTGGWHTVTTRAFIAAYSRARVWSDRNVMYVRTQSPQVTAARFSKCRTCRGGGRVPSTCPGVVWCSSGSEGYSYEWGSCPDEPCEHGQLTGHRMPCSHGLTQLHVTEFFDCWRCRGAGRADYGSKSIHYAWDGAPLFIAVDGEPVGPVRPPRVVTRSVPAMEDTDYDYGALFATDVELGKYASNGRYAREFLAG